MAAVLLFPSAASPAEAQPVGTGGLRGTVTDQTGGVLVGATITVSGAGGEHRTATDSQGRYRFDGLPAGSYAVSASAPGFPLFGTTIAIRAQRTATLDISLRIGVAVSLQVSELGGLSLDPRKNKSALVLSGKSLNSLPEDPQLLLQRLLAMAGSTGRRGDVAVYVDGFREYTRLPPKDTIEMIRVNSNPFSAEFAQPSAMRIEITTKPGSDRYHGQIRAQARSSRLDAKNPLAESSPRSEYRNYNGYLQGPIKKDRVGFMVYAGQWIQDENAILRATILDGETSMPTPYVATVPTPVTVSTLMAKLDLSVFGQAVNTSYTRTSETARGQGLTTGLELADHAYERRTDEQIARLWWTAIGATTVNDARVEVTRSDDATDAVSTAPAVVVLDAFSSGGNSRAGVETTSWTTQATETLTVLRGAHTFKAGLAWQTISRSNVDRSGFNGMFTFGADVERDAAGRPVFDTQGRTTSIAPIDRYRRTLQGVPGYAPSQFSLVGGEPAASVTQWSLGGFFLDDWSVSKRVSLSYGARLDSQNHVRWRPNLAPRMALSWLLDEKGSQAVKIGAGVFYGDIGPEITLDTRRSEAARQRYIVRQPAFFPTAPQPEDLGGSVLTSSAAYTKAQDLRVPRSIVATASYERELPLGIFGVAQYQFVKGTRLLRLRNLAAPATPTAPVAAPVLQFESTGRSMQHEMMVGLRLDANASVSLFANYRLGTLKSDTDGAYSLPADSHNLSAEYGAASEDRRHQVLAGATLTFPRGIMVGVAVSVLSGRPFNITTGRDDNRDSFFLDRPAFAQPGEPGAVVTPFGTFNPNPDAGAALIPRNYGREPWQSNLDISISKTLFGSFTVAGDVQNLLNTTRLVRYSGVLTSPTFGTPNLALNARRFELTVRYGF